MSERLHPYGLGQTSDAAELTHLEGYRGLFTDYASKSYGAVAQLTGGTVEAIWVKNESGGVLLPGACTTWNIANVGKGVAASPASGKTIIGVVDPYIPAAGVADDDHFWLVVKGPAKIISNGAGILTNGDYVSNAGSGKVVEVDLTSTSLELAGALVGQMIETIAATDGLLGRCYIGQLP